MDIFRFLQNATITPMAPADARKHWSIYRQLNGYGPNRPLLANHWENHKTAKASKKGVAVTMGLALAQALMSGHQACRFSTLACRSACVGAVGKRGLAAVQQAAILRVNFLMHNPSAFISLIAGEVDKAYIDYGDELGVRLNTFSDIPWEELAPWLFTDRPHIQWYDYTKWPNRTPMDRYHLTFSASEHTTDEEIISRVECGQNVAVIFDVTRTKPLPDTWQGLSVIDGDVHDARWLDPVGVIVGLRAKGTMRKVGGAMVRQACLSGAA